MDNDYLIEKNDPEELEHLKARRKKLYITSFNSTVLYLIAYLLVYLFYQIITINVAYDFGVKAKLFYWHILWIDRWDSPNWTQYSIKHIFSIGVYASFFLAIFLSIIYIARGNRKGLFPLLCIWLVLHSLNMFFGSVIVGLLTTINYSNTSQLLKIISDLIFFTKNSAYASQGFGYVSDWLYYTSTFKLFLFLGSFIALMVIGFFSAKFFLKTSQSASLVKGRQNRQALILFQTVIPWLFGTLILLLIKFPNDTRYEVYLYLTMLVMVSPALLNVLRDPASFREISILKQNKTLAISQKYLFIMLISYVIFRVAFSFGINVVI